MQDTFVPLIASAGAFLALLLWRVRPLATWRTKKRADREALREAQTRIDAAPEGPERARALCDAADLAAKRVRGRGSAAALYLRAARSDPKSVEVVRRAVAGLARRPRALESLLWRHLATTPWKESRACTATALDALQALYEGPLHNTVRARALANARGILEG
jgi:hypothetical protein